MLYARINDQGEIEETLDFSSPLEIDDIRKDLVGRPVLRPISIDDSKPKPYQVLRAFDYEILDDRVIQHNVFEDRVEDYRAAALTSIDQLAESARQKYITPGAGQSMTYTEKANEARDFKAGVQDPLGFPLLTAEIGITGATKDDVATVILERFANFKMLGAAIERARLTAKAEIADAQDGAAIVEIQGKVVWP